MQFLDLFAGIGMFRIGLEKAGFTCLGHCEIDKFANKSYQAMHDIKGGEWFAEDIRKVKGTELPSCSLWTAGFPCQNLSVAGKRQGLSGDRSGLFYEIIRLLQEKGTKDMPRFLLLENVKGMFSSNGTRDFANILYELAALGYGIEYALINSKNYGVPQNRERVFIVCDLTGRCTGKIFPLGYTNPSSLKQIFGLGQGQRVYAVKGLSTTLSANSGGQGGKTGLYLINKSQKQGIQYREESNCIDANYYKGLDAHQQRTGVLCSAIPHAVITLNRLNKQQHGRRIKNENEPMFTLTAQDIHGILQNSRIRKLTPLECFRLQGVPDSYFEKAAAVCSDSQLYKQAGNGVTVTVVYEIGKKIMELVKAEQNCNN